jgi:hypothetical protein
MPCGLRAEETEAIVWAFVSGLLKDPERLRSGLRRMIEEERKAMRGDPKREAKVWLDKLAEVDRQRTRAQDLAIEGLLSPNELREKLAQLEEQRRTAECELETLRTRMERLARLELEADAVLEQYAEMTPKGLDVFTPEDRHQAYKALRLRVTAHHDGRMEASGVFSSASLVVYDQGTINVST